MKRTRRRSLLPQCPVLLVKPHKIECQVDERVNIFIARAFQRGICEYFPIAAKLPEFGRNVAIETFLTDPHHARKTHIFFLDADTEPVNIHAIERLLSLDKDVVCGVTPLKIGTGDIFSLGWNVQFCNDEGRYENYDWQLDKLPTKPLQVDRVGGTTLLIKRHVLEKLKKPYQKTEFNDDVTNMAVSEDYYFSKKIKKAGFNIWCDPQTICRHYHYIDILDMFEIWRQAKNAKS